MKYAFLTFLIPRQLEEAVRAGSRHNMQDAANALQWHIYEGLCENYEEEIKLFNILPIGSFPQYYNKPFIKTTSFDTDKHQNHVNIGFCNVKLIRKYRQPKKIYAQLLRWCKQDAEPKTLFVYTASAPFLSAVAKVKAKFPSLTVCDIIADLPDMSSLSSKKSFLHRLFEKRQANASYSCVGCVDAFVLLTAQMADYMKITKPFTVMEGISTETATVADRAQGGAQKTILYTGTLHKRFGVLNLVEAFRKIKDPNYRLIICGVGDSEPEIRAAAGADSRIDFRGQVKREDALQLQQSATVLINPRQNNEEFTKYSFPSKNLEYLSSGIPLVAYKLDGIPDEYDTYINYVQNDSIEALRDKLIEVCEDTNGCALERARAAASFVRTEKNSKKQTQKIKQLLQSL